MGMKLCAKRWIGMLAVLLSACLCLPASAEKIEVSPARCVILLPENADGVKKTAAEQLQKHLRLVTGTDLPVMTGKAPLPDRYSFCVGIPVPGHTTVLSREEARWVVTKNATYLYGDDFGTRCGSEFAVYRFLEKELGILWIEPGDDGIVYREQPNLSLTLGDFQWSPRLKIRFLRCNLPNKTLQKELSFFEKTPEEYRRNAERIREWQNRMLMRPNCEDISFGHAFTDWWSRYGKSHPEYFALNKYGKREPVLGPKRQEDPIAVENSAKTIKLCPSNPDVAEQIVQNWKLRRNPSPCVNVCENDNVGGYCRCANCRALDGHDEPDIDSYRARLTDRYLHLTNAVAKAAQKSMPEAVASMYVYNQTEQPPFRERVEPNVILGMVPSTLDLKQLDRWYGAWKNYGAGQIVLRPNYHWCFLTTGIPLGLERQMFDAFQLAVKYGAVGADYDAMQGHWSLSGISDYILARAIAQPEVPFETWENEYYSAFGKAGPEVRNYFRYWRMEVYEKRLLPDFNILVEKGRYYNFARGVLWNLADYYTMADFDRTDAMLQNAVREKLTDAERKRLDRLILSNRHSRLLFQAVTAAASEKIPAAISLLDFRIQYKDQLNMAWVGLLNNEKSAGVTELETAVILKDFTPPHIRTPLFWYFRMDEKNAGLREKWETTPFAMVQKNWDQLPTDSCWETPSPKFQNIPKPLREKLSRYDGIAWYAQAISIPADWKGRKIYLCFGAVDESCEVFVNGRKAGEHLYQKPDDWCTAFFIQIDSCVNWNMAEQRIFVRVEDRGGNGGIWKRVWLVSQVPDGKSPQQNAIQPIRKPSGNH